MGKQRKARNKKSEPQPGLALEQTVARIQQTMDPNSTVTRNETLEDRFGNWRQFDVVIRGQFGGRRILGVIECKDHNRKKGPDAVEAFAKKAENVGANFKIMVSKKGFTKQALRLAKKEFVGCLSLLPKDPNQTGWCIGTFWYGSIRRWEKVCLQVHFNADTPPISGFSSESVLWQGLPVVRWFLRHLFSLGVEEREPGTYSFRIVFDQVRSLMIDGAEYPVKGLTCVAEWVTGKKRKWVSWSGDAFYDWEKKAIVIPPKSAIYGSCVEADPSLWDDFDGELPTPEELAKHPWMTALVFTKQAIPDDMPVPELSGL